MSGDPSCCVGHFGDLWMWLDLMWLQFEIVGGPAGVVWDRFGASLGPKETHAGPKSKVASYDEAPLDKTNTV
jgi:hypothetical protein